MSTRSTAAATIRSTGARCVELHKVDAAFIRIGAIREATKGIAAAWRGRNRGRYIPRVIHKPIAVIGTVDHGIQGIAEIVNEPNRITRAGGVAHLEHRSRREIDIGTRHKLSAQKQPLTRLECVRAEGISGAPASRRRALKRPARQVDCHRPNIQQLDPFITAIRRVRVRQELIDDYAG